MLPNQLSYLLFNVANFSNRTVFTFILAPYQGEIALHCFAEEEVPPQQWEPPGTHPEAKRIDHLN